MDNDDGDGDLWLDLPTVVFPVRLPVKMFESTPSILSFWQDSVYFSLNKVKEIKSIK